MIDDSSDTDLLSYNDVSDYQSLMENSDFIDELDQFSVTEDEIKEILEKLSSEVTL